MIGESRVADVGSRRLSVMTWGIGFPRSLLPCPHGGWILHALADVVILRLACTIYSACALLSLSVQPGGLRVRISARSLT